MNSLWKCLRNGGSVLAFALGSLAFAGSPALASPDHVAGRVLVQFASGSKAADIQAAITPSGAIDKGEIPHTGVHIVSLPAGANEKAFADAFRKRGGVLSAELDSIVPVSQSNPVTPNDPKYTSQWHLPKISAPTAWGTTTGSASVIIAILDTGCDPTHPDLSPKYVPGWNFYDNNSNTTDVYGHGTGVAGTAAACSNNGSGVASLAWGCKIMPIRISDTAGYATYSTAASALTWAADHGARVANISYQMTDSSAITSAAQYFTGKGGIVTIAAGNSAAFDATSDNPYVLTVSATDQNDVLATWSNTGNNVDISAPGVNVYLTTMGGGYGSGSGTSFAAPIVAGAAALVMSANPNLSATEVRSILMQSADDLGAAGWDAKYGAGRVNVARAVAMAGTPPADTTAPTVSITSPGSGATVSGTVNVQANAADNVGVASVSFYVDGALVSTGTTSPFSYSWNTTTAANGSHTLKAVAADAASNSASAQITVTVNNAAADTTPPTVTITSPAAGSIVSGNVAVKVNAADNVGVVKVEFYVDGKLKGSSTSAPFTITWNTRKISAGSHTIYSKAYDSAGNAGSSPTVLVIK